MPNLQPTDAEVFRRAQDAALREDLKVEVGYVVQFYDPNEADVQLSAKRPVPTTDGAIAFEEAPLLPRVPVLALGTSRSFAQISLQAGDRVLVLFTGQSPSEWFEGQKAYEPASLARHSLSNAFAVPVVLPGDATGGHRLALLSDVQAILDKFATWTPIYEAALKTAMATVTLTGTVELAAK
jgi:hypothetical protein